MICTSGNAVNHLKNKLVNIRGFTILGLCACGGGVLLGTGALFTNIFATVQYTPLLQTFSGTIITAATSIPERPGLGGHVVFVASQISTIDTKLPPHSRETIQVRND